MVIITDAMINFSSILTASMILIFSILFYLWGWMQHDFNLDLKQEG